MGKNKLITLLFGILFVLATSATSAVAQAPNADDAKTPAPAEVAHGSGPPPKPGDPHQNLAEAATNPISNLMQFQFQNQTNWKNYESSSYSNAFIVQPVIPFKLPWKKVPLLITRNTLPYVPTQKLRGNRNRHNGIGDITSLNFFVPKLNTKKYMIAMGPAISFPTASSDYTGSGKWAAGPCALYINLQFKGWQWGVMGWYMSSFAGSSRRNYVSQLNFQPFCVKHFAKGWYAGTIDNPGTYNFRTSNWTFPFGPRLGRVFKIGKLNVNAFAETFYSPGNDGASYKWGSKIGLTLLLPK